MKERLLGLYNFPDRKAIDLNTRIFLSNLIGRTGDRADLGGNDTILVPGEAKEAQAPFLTNDLAVVDANDKIRWICIRRRVPGAL